MSRWKIEKDGTGIEKSGTGIEKAGTGIEKSGTGIEKSGTGIERAGTGIERAGTGIQRSLLACALGGLLCAANIQAGTADPAGSLQVVVNDNTVAVSWIIGDSVFSGVSSRTGSYANLMLTEVALKAPATVYEVEVTGSGTGSKTNGTGPSTEVTGSGTGLEVTGSGTGLEVTGSGTGLEVTGSGTGLEVTGSGTGLEVTGSGTGLEVTGSGTGDSIQVTGSGTGGEAITITLPQGTGMSMEVVLDCESAVIAIVDSNFAPIVEFSDVPVIGQTGLCERDGAGGFGAEFRKNPGLDFQTDF